MRAELMRRERAMALRRRTQLLVQRRSRERAAERGRDGEPAGADGRRPPPVPGRVHGLGAVLVLVAMLAGCSAQADDTGDAAAGQGAAGASSPEPEGSSTDHTAGSRRQPPGDASCPVTTPTSPEEVPQVLRRASTSAWYGEDDLWVSLPSLPVTSGRDGTYPIKYGSFTLRNGDFTPRYGPPDTQARRLDGRATVDAGFGGYAYTEEARFWPTGIEFPSPGCWVMTASLKDTEVRFIVRVQDESRQLRAAGKRGSGAPSVLSDLSASVEGESVEGDRDRGEQRRLSRRRGGRGRRTGVRTARARRASAVSNGQAWACSGAAQCIPGVDHACFIKCPDHKGNCV